MPSNANEALTALAELLSNAHAVPIIRAGRAAESTVYDLEYRVVVVACAFDLFATDAGTTERRRLHATRLKLLQFTAIRPWLLATIKGWSLSRKKAQGSWFTSDRLRRGFLGDTTHDRVTELLVARGLLIRGSNGTHLVEGTSEDKGLAAIHRAIAGLQMFSRERETLQALREIKITNEMLEGL